MAAAFAEHTGHAPLPPPGRGWKGRSVVHGESMCLEGRPCLALTGAVCACACAGARPVGGLGRGSSSCRATRWACHEFGEAWAVVCSVAWCTLSAARCMLSALLRGARCLLHVACCLLQSDSMVVHEFGELIRKMFNPRNFRGAVSPHELWQVRAALYCRARTAASRLH